MQAGLWNQYTDPIEGEINVIIVAMKKHYKFIHETKTKYEDKIPFKNDTMHNLHTS